MQGILASFQARASVWKHISASARPHTEQLPGEWNEKLSTYQRLLVLRTLRPDKLVPGIVDYVIEVMGKQYVEPQVCGFAFSAMQAAAPCVESLGALTFSADCAVPCHRPGIQPCPGVQRLGIVGSPRIRPQPRERPDGRPPPICRLQGCPGSEPRPMRMCCLLRLRSV